MRTNRLIAVAFLCAGIACGEDQVRLERSDYGLNIDTSNRVQMVPVSLYTNAALILPFSREVTAGTYPDYSPLMTNATQPDAAARPVSTNAGGGCYKFDGIDDYIRLGLPIRTGWNDAWTVAAWINTTTGGVVAGNFPNTDGNFFQINLDKSSSAKPNCVVTMRSTTARYYGWTAQTNINDGGWHHIAMTKTGAGTNTGVVVYVDGIVPPLTQLNSGTPVSNAATANIILGNRPLLDIPFKGQIDDVRMEQRAWSSNEQWTVYNASKRGKVGPSP